MALIAALGAALDWIAAQADGDLVKGRKKLVDNAELFAEMTRAALTALGFKLFTPRLGAAATAVYAPEGVDSGVVVKELKSRFAAIITNGQGEMKGQIFRIAHLGFFDYLDTIALIGALEQVRRELPLPRRRVRQWSHRRSEGLRRARKIDRLYLLKGPPSQRERAFQQYVQKGTYRELFGNPTLMTMPFITLQSVNS